MGNIFSSVSTDPKYESDDNGNEDMIKVDKSQFNSSELDMAFAMDCTGSMGSYIDNAKRNIQHIVEEIISSEKCDTRLALVEYRDHPPEDKTFVTRSHDFTGSLSKMKRWLNACAAEGGGDAPEAVADALNDVLELNWRPKATKICVLISDAPPHGLGCKSDSFPNGCPAGLDPMQIVERLAKKGIKLYTVGVEPVIIPFKQFFIALAFKTGGQYVPLSSAGLLSKVIIGGAREEISLDQLISEVREEVMVEVDGSDMLNEDLVTDKLHKKLLLKGVKTQHLMRNNDSLDEVSDVAKQLSALSNMSQVRCAKEKTESRPTMADSRELPQTTDSFSNVESDISRKQVHRMVKQAMVQNNLKSS